MRTKKCRRCNGTGAEPDQKKTGEDKRRERIESGFSQTLVADDMGISAAYLSDLERGRRNWSADLLERFRLAIMDK